MKCSRMWTVIVLSCFALVSCEKDPSNGNSKSDCIFLEDDMAMDAHIDDEERNIMDACAANSLSSKSEVITNLIGEWELVGYAHGWFNTGRHPCSTIDISSDQIILDYKHYGIDTLSVHDWDIEVFDRNGDESYRLSFEPSTIIEINQFCSDYMFSNATPVDGNMYLYKKNK